MGRACCFRVMASRRRKLRLEFQEREAGVESKLRRFSIQKRPLSGEQSGSLGSKDEQRRRVHIEDPDLW